MYLIIAFAFWSFMVWLIFRWGNLQQSVQVWALRVLLIAGLMCILGALFLKGDYS